MSYIIKNFQLENNLIPDGIVGIKTLSVMLKKFGLSKCQLSNFLGQCHHETGGFNLPVENLSYSKEKLLSIFPKYFDEKTAAKYEHRSCDIGNIVYANRMGNGDVHSGDGYRFRGRGGLQTTGRDNYKDFSNHIEHDCLRDPDSVGEKFFFDSALFYFKKDNILKIADSVDNIDVYKITKIINGGLNGLDSRLKNTNYYYGLLSVL